MGKEKTGGTEQNKRRVCIDEGLHCFWGSGSSFLDSGPEGSFAFVERLYFLFFTFILLNKLLSNICISIYLYYLSKEQNSLSDFEIFKNTVN